MKGNHLFNRRKKMNIIDITSNFPYLGFRQTAEYSEIIYNINSKTLGVAISINEKYKRIEICQEGFTDLMMFMEYEALDGFFKLSYEKIYDPTSLIPRTMVKFDKDILNEWLMAFNELSKYNKLKSIKASKEHLKEIIEEL